MEENKNFEHNQGIYNAYDYNRTDKDGVSGISKRREMNKENLHRYIPAYIIDSERLSLLDENEIILNNEQVKKFDELINTIKELQIDIKCDNLINVTVNDTFDVIPELKEIKDKVLIQLKEQLNMNKS